MATDASGRSTEKLATLETTSVVTSPLRKSSKSRSRATSAMLTPSEAAVISALEYLARDVAAGGEPDYEVLTVILDYIETGKKEGRLVAGGTLAELLEHEDSITGQCLRAQETKRYVEAEGRRCELIAGGDATRRGRLVHGTPRVDGHQRTGGGQHRGQGRCQHPGQGGDLLHLLRQLQRARHRP